MENTLADLFTDGDYTAKRYDSDEWGYSPGGLWLTGPLIKQKSSSFILVSGIPLLVDPDTVRKVEP